MNTPYRALMWKEAHEARWALYAGFTVLIAVPVLQAAERYARWFGDDSMLPGLSEMTFVSGGAVVMITAIMLASRDFRDGEAAPWRALPIKPFPFVATKFIAGLIASIGVVVIAQFVQMWISWYVGDGTYLESAMHHAWHNALHQLTTHVFLLAALYAIAFALTAASRHVMTAIFLSTIVGALLYFLPLLVPSLLWANFWALIARSPLFTSIEQLRQMGDTYAVKLPGASWGIAYPNVWPMFVTIMLGLTLIGVIATWILVRRNVQLRMDGWRVAWCAVVVGLALFATAGAQIGSNLESDAVKSLRAAPDVTVMNMRTNDDAGMAMVLGPYYKGHFGQREQFLLLTPYDPTTEKLEYDSRFRVAVMWPRHDKLPTRRHWAWSVEHPSIVYATARPRGTNISYRISPLGLSTIDLNAANGPTLTSALSWDSYGGTLHFMDGKLYMLRKAREANGHKLTRFDLSDPRRPQIEKTWGLPLMTDNVSSIRDNSTLTIRLPHIDDLTSEQQFELRMQLWMWPGAFIATSQRIVHYHGGLEVFTVTERDEHHITYERIGMRRESPLESWMTYHFTDALLDGDIVYLLSREGMAVFDVSDPNRIEKIGHYITPEDSLRCLVRLPDGRVAACGREMHVFDLE